MKLARVGEAGSDIPCVMDKNRDALDAYEIAGDLSADMASLPLIETADIRIGSKYSARAAEANLPIPSHPILFNKASGAYCGPSDGIPYFPKMTEINWEVELGVVIGKPAPNIGKEEALDPIFGCALVNHVS